MQGKINWRNAGNVNGKNSWTLRVLHPFHNFLMAQLLNLFWMGARYYIILFYCILFSDSRMTYLYNICHSVISSQYFSHLFLHFLVCNKVKCGDRGCQKEDTSFESCCHEECLGGCFQLKSSHHCYACRHLRQMSNGECVKKCQSHLFEVKYFIFAGELTRGAYNPNLQCWVVQSWVKITQGYSCEMNSQSSGNS